MGTASRMEYSGGEGTDFGRHPPECMPPTFLVLDAACGPEFLGNAWRVGRSQRACRVGLGVGGSGPAAVLPEQLFVKRSGTCSPW